MAFPSGPPATRDDGGENREVNDRPEPVIKVEEFPTDTSRAGPDMRIHSNNNGCEARAGLAQQTLHLLPANHLSGHRPQSQMLSHQDRQRKAEKRNQENLPPSQSQQGHPVQNRSLEPRHDSNPSTYHLYGIQTASGRLERNNDQLQLSDRSGMMDVMTNAAQSMNTGLRPGFLSSHPSHDHAAAQPVQTIDTTRQPDRFRSEEVKRSIFSFAENMKVKYRKRHPMAFDDAQIYANIVVVLAWMQQYPGIEFLNQYAFSKAAEVAWKSRLPFGLSMKFSTIATRRDPAFLDEQQSRLDGIDAQIEDQIKSTKPESTASQSNIVAKYHSSLRVYYSGIQAKQGYPLIPYRALQSAAESTTQCRGMGRPEGFFEALEYNAANLGGHQSDYQTGCPGHVDIILSNNQTFVRGIGGPTTQTPELDIVHHDENRAVETDTRGISCQHIQRDLLEIYRASHTQNHAVELPKRLDRPSVGSEQFVGASPAETDVTEFPGLFSEEFQPGPKIVNVLGIFAKVQVLPANFRRVLSSNIVKKVLFLALHGMPSAAIAHEVQGEFPKPALLRVSQRIEKIGTAIDHYLLRIVAEVEREGEADDFFCKLLSHATSNDWLPRSLHNAIEYIYSETIEGTLTGLEERIEAAKARTALRKWRCNNNGADPNPSAIRKRSSDHGSSPNAKRRKSAVLAYRGLQRERQDYQHLVELGYREGDDDHEKAVMLEWLESIKQKKRLPSLLEVADLIRGE